MVLEHHDPRLALALMESYKVLDMQFAMPVFLHVRMLHCICIVCPQSAQGLQGLIFRSVHFISKPAFIMLNVYKKLLGPISGEAYRLLFTQYTRKYTRSNSGYEAPTFTSHQYHVPLPFISSAKPSHPLIPVRTPYLGLPPGL